MAKLSFDGRVAIVTGAGKGMGREHAVMLASRGARVVANDVVAEDADEVVATITSAGGQAIADYSDVADGAAALVQSAIDAFGQLDILVNNAGIIRVGLFWEQEPEEWWKVFNVSLRGTIEVTRAAWPHLMKSGTGRVINVASSGMLANPGASAYGAAKGAIWAFSNTLAAEGARVGVQVTTLMPSAWTPMTENAYDDPDVVNTLRDKLSPSHVAAFVTFLAHQDCAVAGDTFQVSGGRAGRMTLAALPPVRPEESTPEGWADMAKSLEQDSDDLTQYRETGKLFGDEMIAASPDVAEALSRKNPADLGA